MEFILVAILYLIVGYVVQGFVVDEEKLPGLDENIDYFMHALLRFLSTVGWPIVLALILVLIPVCKFVCKINTYPWGLYLSPGYYLQQKYKLYKTAKQLAKDSK